MPGSFASSLKSPIATHSATRFHQRPRHKLLVLPGRPSPHPRCPHESHSKLLRAIVRFCNCPNRARAASAPWPSPRPRRPSRCEVATKTVRSCSRRVFKPVSSHSFKLQCGFNCSTPAVEFSAWRFPIMHAVGPFCLWIVERPSIPWQLLDYSFPKQFPAASEGVLCLQV